VEENRLCPYQGESDPEASPSGIEEGEPIPRLGEWKLDPTQLLDSGKVGQGRTLLTSITS